MIATLRTLRAAVIGLSASLASLAVGGSRARRRLRQSPHVRARGRALSRSPTSHGQPFALPFLGGLDVPRPQFVDIDGDGDLDLFLQEYSQRHLVLREHRHRRRRRGTSGAPTGIRISRSASGIASSISTRDGDLDLLAEQPFSNIRFYRNAGTQAGRAVRGRRRAPGHRRPAALPRSPEHPGDRRSRLRRPARLVHRPRGGPGHALRGGRARVGDVRVPHRPLRGHRDHRRGGGAGRRLGPSTRHGANALAFADFDGDKDLDLFWGDFFEPGVLLIQNIGATCSTPSFQVDPVPAAVRDDTRTSGYNAPAPDRPGLRRRSRFPDGRDRRRVQPGDDGGGQFLFLGAHRRRTASSCGRRAFSNGIDLGSETVPALVDLDGDGDLDLIVGNKIDPARATPGA